LNQNKNTNISACRNAVNFPYSQNFDPPEIGGPRLKPFSLMVNPRLVSAHTQGCQIKKRNGKLVMHAWKRQVNQASWNGTVLTFGLENQWDIHNYNHSSFFMSFLWSHDLESYVIITLVSTGCGSHIRRIPPC